MEQVAVRGNDVQSLIITLVLVSSFLFSSATRACSDPGFLIAFNSLGDDSAVDVSASASTTLVAGLPRLVYEGGWGSTKTLLVARTECMSQALENLPEDMQRFAVRAAFRVAPLGASVVPSRVPEQCSEPMVLVGFTRVIDAEKNGAYSRAVVKSNLPRLHGFVPLFNGRPATLISGDWPEGYSTSVSTWPCQEAFDAFYFGDEYVQQIKPLRAGAGDYIIAGFSPTPGAVVRDTSGSNTVSP